MIISKAPLELNPATRTEPARVQEVARKLEGQFAQMLIKSMRDASFGDSLFPGENQTFRDMYDQQLATELTKGKGLGLAPVIARQLAQQSGTAEDAGTPLDTQLPGAVAASLPLQAADRAFDLIAGRADAAGSADATQMPSAPAQDGAVSGLDRWIQAYQANAGSPSNTPSTGAAAEAAAATFTPRSPEHFVARIWDHAQAAARELGVDAKALVAQAALETGWGRRMIGSSSAGNANNLFGIKATGWGGKSATVSTTEYYGGVKTTEQAAFRAYDSTAESFADYVRLLKSNPRYQQALQSGGDVQRFASALQKAGYATDPRYAEKISAIANGPTLDKALSAITQFAGRAAETATGLAGSTFASAADTVGNALRR